MDVFAEAEVEFLTDRASYFADKKDVYIDIKTSIAENLHISKSMIRVCGSAYWGKSFTTGEAFEPGASDLDLGLVSDRLFTQLLMEVRVLTKHYTNLTSFQGIESPDTFQDYALKKGIIRLDIAPRTPTKLRLDALAASLSKRHRKHFHDISFRVYDTDVSFAVKQVQPLQKFGHLP